MEQTSEHFPSNDKGKQSIDIILVGFDRPLESEQVTSELRDQGLRPATLKELLALGVSHPRLQREMNIAALGSIWRFGHDDMVACLMGGEDARDLRLLTSKGDWRPFWRFAAVKIE